MYTHTYIYIHIQIHDHTCTFMYIYGAIHTYIYIYMTKQSPLQRRYECWTHLGAFGWLAVWSSAMIPGKRNCSRFQCFLLILCHCAFLVMFQTSSCAFGRPKQPSGSELQERTGQATRRKVKDSVGYMTEISDSEKQLLTRIAIASEKRDWDKVQSHFATYTGTATPIYNAVMNAALRCRRYREGASTYEKCRETCDDLTANFQCCSQDFWQTW